MEYFVDEMPRDCASCKHYHMNCADGYSCSKLRKEIHPNFSEGIGYRHQDCPLQSLADYTKQVRKEVCEKIREWHDEEERNIDRLVENVENLCSNDLKPMWDKWHEEMTKQIKETIKGE